MAAVAAVVMGVCGSGVAAWAVAGYTCNICGSNFYVAPTATGVTYQERYGVPTIDGMSNDSSHLYSEMDTLLVALHSSGAPICKSCLETIINNYKAAQSTGPSGSTDVTAVVASSYSIIVPQAITLDGSGQSGTYSKTFAVTVKGDIGENQQVTVTATPPTMKCTGCADVAATFTAGYKTTWNRSEAAANSYAGTAANYTVSATLTPGEWTGTATFACSRGG